MTVQLTFEPAPAGRVVSTETDWPAGFRARMVHVSPGLSLVDSWVRGGRVGVRALTLEDSDVARVVELLDETECERTPMSSQRRRRVA